MESRNSQDSIDAGVGSTEATAPTSSPPARWLNLGPPLKDTSTSPPGH